MSLFNFVCYREHQLPELGPFHEPPFHVLSRLADRDRLARQAQWYFLAAIRNSMPVLPALAPPSNRARTKSTLGSPKASPKT